MRPCGGKRASAVWCTGLLLVGVAGCGISGKWQLANVEPTAARPDFDFQTLTLEKDGTYHGDPVGESESADVGTYRYQNNVLVLTSNDGETRRYDAALKNSGNELQLQKFWMDQKVKADFRRVQ
jgi:hypothetical protein